MLIAFDYAINILTSESSDDALKNQLIDAKIGQIHGSFGVGTKENPMSFRKVLIDRYNQNGNKLSSWNYAGIEAPTGTLFDINNSEVEIDDTGYLNISSNFNIINDIILKGRKFYEKVISPTEDAFVEIQIYDSNLFNDNSLELIEELDYDKFVSISIPNEALLVRDYEFIDLSKYFNNEYFPTNPVKQVLNPIENCLYPVKDNGDCYFWHNGEWHYVAPENNDGDGWIKVNDNLMTDLIIDYICEVTREV